MCDAFRVVLIMGQVCCFTLERCSYTVVGDGRDKVQGVEDGLFIEQLKFIMTISL